MPARELRIALAMRGGVSLAVWMGGACSEVDALRRADPTSNDSASLYSRILHATGYSGATVDVIAGASAGGLNGALMASSVVYDMPFGDDIRDLWLCLGDIETLQRRTFAKSPPSVLDGDGKFFAPLYNHLLQRCSEAPVSGNRVDLSLTGTLLDPRPIFRYQHLGSAISEGRHNARFRFRHMLTGTIEDSDFVPPDGRRAALARLAYAARATSSFPGAFEPASIGFAPSSTAPDGAIPATHCGVYSESRNENSATHDRDYVIDGGVLDNIPVAWAVRSIAAAPADVHVDRWLVYLQPIPFPASPPSTTASPGLSATVRRARKLRSETERLADDIDELRRLRVGSLLREGFRQVVEYALGEARENDTDPEFLSHLYKRALVAAEDYRKRQGAVEVERLRQLWTEPLAVLGVDPLGYRDLEQVNAHDKDLTRLIRELNLADGGDLVLPLMCVAEPAESPPPPSGSDRAGHLITIGRKIRTPQALARTVAALLEAARDCEDAGLRAKDRLYCLRAEIELLVARHDRLLAQEPLLRDAGPVELARRASWRLLSTTSMQAELEPAWPEHSFAWLWDALVEEAIRLAEAAQGVEERALLSCLVKAGAMQAERHMHTEAVLIALEVLTGPLRPDPLTESAHIQFHMLSAANRSPLPALKEPPNRKGVEEKLAGNQLANFGAFLSARWRLNDWTWGRLDAARSLVEIMTARLLSADTDGAGLAALAAVVGADADAPATEIVERLVGQAHKEILKQELPYFSVVKDKPPLAQELHEAASRLHGNANVLQAVGDEKLLDLLLRNPARASAMTMRIAATAVRAWLRL